MINTLTVSCYESSPAISAIEAIENIFLVKRKNTVDSNANINWYEAVYAIPSSNLGNIFEDKDFKYLTTMIFADNYARVTVRLENMVVDLKSPNYIECAMAQASNFRWDSDWMQPLEDKVLCIRPYKPTEISLTYSSYKRQDFLSRQAFGLWFVFSAEHQGWVYGQTPGFVIARLESPTLPEADYGQGLTDSYASLSRLWLALQFQRFNDYADVTEFKSFMSASQEVIANAMEQLITKDEDGVTCFIDDDSVRRALSLIPGIKVDQDLPFVSGVQDDVN